MAFYDSWSTRAAYASFGMVSGWKDGPTRSGRPLGIGGHFPSNGILLRESASFDATGAPYMGLSIICLSFCGPQDLEGMLALLINNEKPVEPIFFDSTR